MSTHLELFTSIPTSTCQRRQRKLLKRWADHRICSMLWPYWTRRVSVSSLAKVSDRRKASTTSVLPASAPVSRSTSAPSRGFTLGSTRSTMDCKRPAIGASLSVSFPIPHHTNGFRNPLLCAHEEDTKSINVIISNVITRIHAIAHRLS